MTQNVSHLVPGSDLETPMGPGAECRCNSQKFDAVQAVVWAGARTTSIPRLEPGNARITGAF